MEVTEETVGRKFGGDKKVQLTGKKISCYLMFMLVSREPLGMDRDERNDCVLEFIYNNVSPITFLSSFPADQKTFIDL